MVCLQEVSEVSFEEDFAFMEEIGYDGKELFKKGRFRPATFWKTSVCELQAPPVHKDRTLLTAFRKMDQTWFVLNCHLQAGPQGPRRVRQIHEGARAAMTLCRKLKSVDKPETQVPLLVCGDFNGGPECGAVRYLEDGFVDETFREDGTPVSSGRKELPLAHPMQDVAGTPSDRPAPPTMVVAELISVLVEGEAYGGPSLSNTAVSRLKAIYEDLATAADDQGRPVMGLADVERYLVRINGQVGRGSEFREAAKQMGWVDEGIHGEDGRPKIELPKDGTLSFDGFKEIYERELQQGKFWGIAHDLAILGQALPDAGVFESRFDRIYASKSVQTKYVMDFTSEFACPNHNEPSDHLPVAALFQIKD